MKTTILHRVSLALLPPALSMLLRLWFATCRVTEHGREHRQDIDRGHSIVAVFWHYCLLYVFYHLKDDRAAVLVSASDDGDYIARLAHWLNFETVRGSSNRRGLLALKELLRRQPGITSRFVRRTQRSCRYPVEVEHCIDGLRRTGLPE